MATTTPQTWTSPLAHFSSDLTTIDDCRIANVYSDTDAEYNAIRESVAISDNCHYGKFVVRGADAQDAVNLVVLADVARLAIGRATWTFLLRSDGSLICDAYVLCTGDDYIILTEGASPETVREHLTGAMEEHAASVEDITTTTAIIAIDGPYAWELLKQLVGVRILGLRYLEFIDDQKLGDNDVRIIRSGKTGEFGYQLLMDAKHVTSVWSHLVEGGAELDVAPAGAEVLSLCRMENRFINMHREGADARNPLEINCRVMIDEEKDEFIGYEALEEATQSPLERRVIGIVVEGDASQVPSLGAEVKVEDEVLGRVVNSGFSRQLGKPIALAALDAEVAYVGLTLAVAAGESMLDCKTVSAPFIYNKSLTVRPQEDSYKTRKA
ncbi:MAG TPA: hypothetical protein DDW52_16200 [Planctomycetaceae bacterium]|nr:hypothetical protein [Planctomycetaceae bacterium]